MRRHCTRIMSMPKKKPAMKGEVINCSAHKDIYFLETNTKSESANLANLFAPPSTGREMFKYKPRPKLKQKLNPALEFFIQNNSTNTGETSNQTNNHEEDKCTSSNSTTIDLCRNRSSIDKLYEEAASILGLTCSQTDDCKCLECQCHYFDFEDDMEFPAGMDNFSCTIQ